ncbi:MAG: Hsp70 family protein [Actinomycetota bacterium]|nr:Hsp70 family protein [Actinomycetota bacterium]
MKGYGLVGYALGVDIGTCFTAAAICRLDDHQLGKAEVVALGSRLPSVSSVLFLGADGSVVVGEAAERRALTDPDRVVREFKRRIGDDTPLFVGGQPYAAHDLAAMMVRWVVDRIADREGELPDRIAITHPAGWGPYKKDLLSGALGAAGLDNLTFLAEPEAAAISYAAQERVETGTTIAVYDLGGGTFDAAVVRKIGAGSFALLGSADGLEQLGGADFDEAVFHHVQAVLGVQMEIAQLDQAQWDALDVEDPSVLSGLARLRRECTEAKEALSVDTVVSIPVLLPGVSAQVRLVRSEFEEMIRPSLENTVDSLCRAIRSAGVCSGDLGAVLLVGGSSRVPLVSQLVSARLGCPVVVDADPKTTIVLGAVLSMIPQSPTAQTSPAPATTGGVAPAAVSPEHLPDRPPFIPAQRQSFEDTEDDAPPRLGIVTRQLRNAVGVAALAGVLLVPLAVTAASDRTSSTDGSGGTTPASAGPPGDAAASGSGDPARVSSTGRSDAPRGQDEPAKVAQTTAGPPVPTSTPPPTPSPSPKPSPSSTTSTTTPTTTTTPTATTTTTETPPPPPTHVAPVQDPQQNLAEVDLSVM